MNRTFITGMIAIITVFAILPSFTLTSFSHNNDIPAIDIVINKENFNNLLSENNKGVQFPVTVSINNAEYVSVKFNTRGQSSYRDGLETETKRLPFEISFEPYISFGDFNNITSLKLNNSFSLYSLLAEYIALKIYEHMDVPVSEASPVFLSFNGIDYGLYLGVEDINESFLSKNFDGDVLKNANLYKSVDVDGDFISDNVEYFSTSCFGTLYCKSGNGDHKTLLAFLDALDNGKNFEQYLNMDEVIRFFACTAATGGADTLLTTTHNAYLYEYNGKISFIPWDLSYAFDCFDDNYSIRPDYETSSANKCFELIMSKEENLKKYYEYLEEICETFLNPEIINPFIDNCISSVAEYCKRDRSTVFNPDTSLKYIADGNYLVHGNIKLSVNEVYRQIGEQLSYKSDFFYIPDHLEGNLFNGLPEDELFSDNSAQVIEDILHNYKSSYIKNQLSLSDWQGYAAFSAFTVFLVAVYLSYRIPKGKRKK